MTEKRSLIQQIPTETSLRTALREGFLDLQNALAGKAPETQRKYQDWISSFYLEVLDTRLLDFRQVPIEEFVQVVSPAVVEAWLGKYAAAGHSRSGLGQARAAIVFVARVLVLARQAPSTLWHDLQLVKMPDNAVTATYGESTSGSHAARWLAPEEVRLLITTAKMQPNRPAAHRDVTLLWLMVTLGLRREEAAGLKWQNLTKRGNNWVMRVQGKRNKWRAIALPLETIQAMQPWARELSPNGLPTGYIVRRVWRSGRVAEEGISGNGVWRIIKKLWQQAALPGDIAPHDLRRTAAALALEAGATEREIQQMLGHSSIETTHRYLAPMRENTATYRIANMLSQEDSFFNFGN